MTREEMIPGEYYFWNNSADHPENGEMYSFIGIHNNSHICINTKYLHKGYYNNYKSYKPEDREFQINIRPATGLERKWLDICIEEEKFIECPHELKWLIINSYEIY